MSRGRPPAHGLEIALPVARERGQLVMQFVQVEECPADFMFICGQNNYFIRLRRAVPFRRTPEQLEAEFRDLMRQLRCIPGCREFWIYSKKGSLRFFRVEDNGLVEIGRDGRPLPPEAKGVPRMKAVTGGMATPPEGITPITPAPKEKNPVLGMVEKKPAKGSV